MKCVKGWYKIPKNFRTDNCYFLVKPKITHCHRSSELCIHHMNLVSCLINTLNESCNHAEVSGKFMIVSEGQGQQMQFVIFDFGFKSQCANFGPIFVLKLTGHSFCFIKNKFSFVKNHYL